MTCFFSRLRRGSSSWGIRLWPLPTPVRRSLLLLFVEFPGGVLPKKMEPMQFFFRGDYTPRKINQHGTWEFSPLEKENHLFFSKASFSGSMSIFRGVQLMFFFVGSYEAFVMHAVCYPLLMVVLLVVFGFPRISRPDIVESETEWIKMSPEGTPKTGKEERPPAAARERAEKLLAKARAIGSQMQALVGWVFFYKITRTFQYLHAKPKFVLFNLKKSK